MQSNKQELRQRLREKIRSKRDSQKSMPQLAQRLKDDPTSAMMSMGVDDAQLLANAAQIIKHPHRFVKDSIDKLKESSLSPVSNDDNEEEAPPELFTDLTPEASIHTCDDLIQTQEVTLPKEPIPNKESQV